MEKEHLKTLFSEKTIRNRIASMAENIARTCPGNECIVIGLLKGSFMFLADLVRELNRHGMRLQIDFIPVSSYGAAKASSGRIRILRDLHLEIKDRDILLVDDILDSGWTLHRIINLLKRKNPSGLQTCVLLDKPSRRMVPLKADFVGFTIPDTFVVGYGLDFNNRYRELPYISELTETPSSK